jgi:hypothetical protein
MHRYVINVLIESKEPLKGDLDLCDLLASRTYNRIAMFGKTADVTAKLVEMPPLAWEVKVPA